MSWFDKWIPGSGYRYVYTWSDLSEERTVLEAFRFDHEHEPQWYRDNLGTVFDDSRHGELGLRQGALEITVPSGDWVVRGPNERYFVVPHRIFIKLAEPA